MGNSFLGLSTSRIYDSKHIFTFSTIGSTSTGDHRTFPLISLDLFASASLPDYRFPTDPPISLCNSTAMSLPLAQTLCGMPRSIILCQAPPLGQPTTDDTVLVFIQPRNPSKQDAEALQPTPGSSSLLPSPLQHQPQFLQAIHTTIQQFHQHLKTEQLDRKTLQTIVLQLQNDFALLRSLLFSWVGSIPISDTSVKNPATSPPINRKPNQN